MESTVSNVSCFCNSFPNQYSQKAFGDNNGITQSLNFGAPVRANDNLLNKPSSGHFDVNQVHLPSGSSCEVEPQYQFEHTTSRAQKKYSIAQQQGVDLAEKGFCVRLAAFAFATFGIGLAALSIVFSGGTALPIGIAVVAGVVAILLVTDTISAYVDWRMRLNGGEGLPLGADSLGNFLNWIFQKVGVNKESAFKWARRISIPNRVVFTVANLLVGAPGPGLDFTLTKPNSAKKLHQDNIETLQQKVRDLSEMNDKLVQYNRTLEAKLEHNEHEFKRSSVPLKRPKREDFESSVDAAFKAYDALKETYDELDQTIESAKEQLRLAEIKVAKKRFWSKLFTTVVITVGTGMAVFGTITSGGLIAPLALLSFGMACVSLADTCHSFGHWQSLKHGGDGLPEAHDSIANIVNMTLFNSGCKPETAHRWASRVSTVAHVALPIFQLWPLAQLPDEIEELKTKLELLADLEDRLFIELGDSEDELNHLNHLKYLELLLDTKKESINKSLPITVSRKLSADVITNDQVINVDVEFN